VESQVKGALNVSRAEFTFSVSYKLKGATFSLKHTSASLDNQMNFIVRKYDPTKLQQPLI